MTLNLWLEFERDFFELEQADQAIKVARLSGSDVYTWKTTCRSNWLERGLSNVDALGLVVLPAGLNDIIDMPDDPRE